MGVIIMGIEKRIILLGERHGDPKSPKRIRKVLERVEEPYTFLLELEESIRPELNKYFEDKSLDVLETTPVKLNKGKLTEEMLELLDEIQENNKIELIKPIGAKKEGESGGDYFERILLENIRRLDGRVVALLGQTHANKAPITATDLPGGKALFNHFKDGTMRPVGYLLQDEAYSIHLGRMNELQTYDEEVL